MNAAAINMLAAEITRLHAEVASARAAAMEEAAVMCDAQSRAQGTCAWSARFTSARNALEVAAASIRAAVGKDSASLG